MGKLSDDELRTLLACIKKDLRVIVPPMAGYDSGVHKIGDNYLVVSTDPCTGAPKQWFGYLLVNYAASDVALFGAKPEFCTINLLGPPATQPETFRKIMQQTCHAADELQMAIVTGHTGTYQGLSSPVGVCTAYGMINIHKLITPGGAKPGDYIYCIKSLGLEVAVNLALTRKIIAKRIFGTRKTQELAKLVHLQSCVSEALSLAQTGGVHAMHDATEGGLVSALNEMAEASKVGFTIDFGRIPISNEVLRLQKYFELSDEQLLSVSSTGTVIASISKEKILRARKVIEKDLKLRADVLGTFTSTKDRILIMEGKEIPFPKEAHDPYERILSAKL